MISSSKTILKKKGDFILEFPDTNVALPFFSVKVQLPFAGIYVDGKETAWTSFPWTRSEEILVTLHVT